MAIAFAPDTNFQELVAVTLSPVALLLVAPVIVPILTIRKPGDKSREALLLEGVTVIVRVEGTVPLKSTLPVVPANAGEFATREAVAAKPEAKRMRLNLFIITSDVSDVQSNIDCSNSNTSYVLSCIILTVSDNFFGLE
jgi:hypothetical protein